MLRVTDLRVPLQADADAAALTAALKKLRLSAVISVIPLIEQLLMHPADISPATVSIAM